MLELAAAVANWARGDFVATPDYSWRDSVTRQAEILRGSPLHVLRALWDQYDGANSPEGWEGEAIHLALNLVGDGRYCSV